MTSNGRAGVILAAAGLALLIPQAVGTGQPTPPVEDMIAGNPAGPWRRLFLDAMVVERHEGLSRVFHAAKKHPANPVLRADRAWEQGGSYAGPYLYGTVTWDEGKLRMWYHCHHSGYINCYAESEDGINWTKPNLGIIEFEGSKDSNLVITVSQDPDEKPPYKASGQCHNPSVIKRAWEPDPEKRYALFCYGVDYRHARLAFSPDGLHWTFPPESREKGLFSSGDVLNFFWDPYQQRYVATWKAGSRRGRAAGVVFSNDSVQWTKPVEGPVMVADDLDPDATQIYGMPVFPYQGIYVGLPWVYNARWFKYGGYADQRMYEVEKDSPCTMDVQLAWSWDLINWTRPAERYQFIPRGADGEFDSGMIYTARAPVQVGDELWFYYGGWDGPHNDRNARANIGLAAIRMDGFCSMHAGDQEGWLITRREPFSVPKVTINARTSQDGYVVAELLDKDNNVIESFSRDDCVPFTSDSIRHVLKWQTEELPAAYAERDKKLRFFLRNADIYSYLPDQTLRSQTVTWVPTENGGLLASDRAIPENQRFVMAGKPSGYRIVSEGGWVYADLHSVAADKTNACFWRDANWTDDTDWCVEAWYRVVDMGTEPSYGLSTWMRPDFGRGAAMYLSQTAVGIQSSQGNDHRVLETFEMDATDRFRWYRLVHEGGADGSILLFVDGKEVIRTPFPELFLRRGRGHNIMFGPNAAHCEGRMHVARFGYRIGGTEQIFGPIGGPTGE